MVVHAAYCRPKVLGPMPECQNRIRTNMQTAGGSEFGIGFPAERIMIKFRLLLLPLLLLAWTSQGSGQFAHTDHKQIVDAAGKPLLLRATNLGNWMVPEGYMWLFQGGPQSPGEIRALVFWMARRKAGPFTNWVRERVREQEQTRRVLE